MATIALISTNDHAPWGGSEELWSQTAIALSKQGHDVRTSVRRWPTDPSGVKAMEAAGVEVNRRGLSAATARLLARFPYRIQHGIEVLRYRRQFAEWLRKTRPALAIVSQGTNHQALQFLEVIAEQKVRYVIVTQLAMEHDWPLDEMAERLAICFGEAEKAYFVSKANQALTEKQIGMLLPNAALVRNPFRVPYDSTISWPSAAEGIKLACVAALNPFHKGQDLLLEVLAQEKWRKRSVTLTLFGNGPYKRSLQYLLSRLPQQNVRLGGFADDVTQIWKDHHALLMGSRGEGLPLALVEAMLCGRVCIVPNVGGNAELIDDGMNGFLASAPTVELLDGAIERAWARLSEWPEIGKKAAASAHAAIPPDPVSDFAESLLALLPSRIAPSSREN